MHSHKLKVTEKQADKNVEDEKMNDQVIMTFDKSCTAAFNHRNARADYIY